MAKTLQIVTLMIAVLFSSGCTQLRNKWKPTPKASAKDPVYEILCLWSPSRGKRPNGDATRGFAGQVMFFTHGSRSPVEVEGNIVIEQFVGADDSKPLHTFRFDNTAWRAHLAKGHLGPTYNVFVPLMVEDNGQTKCQLRVSLEAPKCPPIASDMAQVILENTDKKSRGASPRSRAVQVSHETSRKRKLRTTTIRPGLEHVEFEDSADGGERQILSADADAKVDRLRDRLNRIRRSQSQTLPRRSNRTQGLDLTGSNPAHD